MDIWQERSTSQLWRSAPLMSCRSMTRKKYRLLMQALHIVPIEALFRGHREQKT